MVDTLSGQPMNEVLASIRRIIADEAPVARPAPPEEDILELGVAPEPPAPMPSQASAPAPALETLLSEDSASASRLALDRLSGLSIDPDARADSLDGLVREMLRPMLKTWLDERLPEIVERMVAREIARIGGR